jgi:K+/H+ antiporter YhaU regulatory subunit KhtT
VRAETGVTVIAVERDGESFTELDPDFVLEAGDDLLITGTDEGIGQFDVATG